MSLNEFLNREVEVEIVNGEVVRGKLIFVGESMHRGFGELMLKASKSWVIVRVWKTIRLL